MGLAYALNNLPSKGYSNFWKVLDKLLFCLTCHQCPLPITHYPLPITHYPDLVQMFGKSDMLPI
ncbi:hypothetical protein [Moorena sp. SIO3A5]|uniref:hypothetical protein n=1 Tax=Moorena sp. SIO3A5 TaxID=2607822 RepID=UPI0003108FE5|nr:hypothetical protein [Moorena sp. SIO3A5]